MNNHKVKSRKLAESYDLLVSLFPTESRELHIRQLEDENKLDELGEFLTKIILSSQEDSIKNKRY